MSSQKFIRRNRPPRVQIEYEVETYGAAQKKELPFVMAAMADLTGNYVHPSQAPDSSGKPPPGTRATRGDIAEREFLEISVDNFDSRMKGMQPGVAFTVPNTLTGQGNLRVEMTFDKLDDFSPAAIARKVPSLKHLLEAREKLKNLLTFMDGKSDAEQLIAEILNDKTKLQSVAGAAAPAEETPAKPSEP